MVPPQFQCIMYGSLTVCDLTALMDSVSRELVDTLMDSVSHELVDTLMDSVSCELVDTLMDSVSRELVDTLMDSVSHELVDTLMDSVSRLVGRHTDRLHIPQGGRQCTTHQLKISSLQHMSHRGIVHQLKKFREVTTMRSRNKCNAF